MSSNSWKKLGCQKPWLASETDVDEYLESLRKALIEEINQDKHIQV